MNKDKTIKSFENYKLKRDTKLTRTHVILDVYKCDDIVLSKAKVLEQRVMKVLKEFKLEPKIQTFYQFQPFGVTAIVCAQGLQFTVHTWPEHKSAALDLYCFKGKRYATEVCGKITTIFQSSEHEMKVRTR